METVDSSINNILITGASGWLGQFVYKHLIDINNNIFNINNIYGLYNSTIPIYIPESNRVNGNLSNYQSIETILLNIKPKVIIHLAAISAPGTCHKDPKLAQSINCPNLLIELIQIHFPDSLFIFTSTDLVFDGNKGSPYLPNDQPNPVNVYGETKYNYEQQVLQLNHGIVLRLSNIIGPKFVYQSVGCKFMQFLYESYTSRQYIGLRDDEIRSFVFVDDITNLIALIIKKYLSNDKIKGIFHVGGANGLSRLNLASILANSDGNELIVKTNNTISNDNSNYSNPWIVYTVSNAEGNQSSGINNPKDVSMDSSYTEQYFNFKFTSMTDAVPICLKSFK